ncbi:alpha/beta hydrolase [Rhodococcoides corynebacterioides]|uniref:alpha/beta hydrolase n=1 Tax=Rhodococcoides corynebacterioides TaxID=53972 RepID=UPI001C9B9E1A|nr:alpha/beta hydrolase [Rhodococcus corynebacterioides]MBY6364313.1 alpha/beta fold hydrolase [Rhodococcus corynebacterioides]
MTRQFDYVRSDVTFDSSGTRCAAWLYRPQGVANPPIVVLAHGFAAFRELRLDAYAARFAQAGYAALVFDHRHWGASAGFPRRILDIGRQQADWDAAMDFTRRIEGVDTTRVVGWGSSFGGGHVLRLVARDRRLAAAIVQVPHVSGPASAFFQSPRAVARLIAAGMRDQFRAWTGRSPYRLAAVGRPGDTAMMTAPGAYELVERMGDMREELLAENDVAARIALRMPFYSPGRHAAAIDVPVLVQLAAHDEVTPIDTARSVVDRIPKGEVHVYECGHFEPYLDPFFDTIVTDQIHFLDRHVGDAR